MFLTEKIVSSHTRLIKPRHEYVWSGGIAPHVLNLGAAVSFEVVNNLYSSDGLAVSRSWRCLGSMRWSREQAFKAFPSVCDTSPPPRRLDPAS